MTPFWWTWSSWAVEIPTGLGLQLFLHLWGPRPPAPPHAWWLFGLVGAAISLGYELWLDRHGWAWRDVLQRAVGQVALELVWAL